MRFNFIDDETNSNSNHSSVSLFTFFMTLIFLFSYYSCKFLKVFRMVSIRSRLTPKSL